eukprot:8338856-Pyramimonas_sp.AAC.1
MVGRHCLAHGGADVSGERLAHACELRLTERTKILERITIIIIITQFIFLPVCGASLAPDEALTLA